MSRKAPYSLIVATAILAVLLGMVALPEVLLPWRPFWLGLVLVFWLLEAPDRIGLALAFVWGLIADLAFGSLLGEHALRLCVMAFIIQRFRPRLRFFYPWQQALAILVLFYNDRLIALAVRLVSGDGLAPASYWLAPITAAVLWPWLYVLMDGLRTRWRQRES